MSKPVYQADMSLFVNIIAEHNMVSTLCTAQDKIRTTDNPMLKLPTNYGFQF